jgi:hypothetical protein
MVVVVVVGWDSKTSAAAGSSLNGEPDVDRAQEGIVSDRHLAC